MWSGTDNQVVGALAAVAADLAISWLVASLAGRLAAAGFSRARGRDTAPTEAPAVGRAVQLVRRAVFLLVALALVDPALEAAGVQIPWGPQVRELATWFLRSGLRVILTAVLAFVAMRMVSLAVDRFEADLGAAGSVQAQERAKRAKTLGALVRNAANTAIVTMAILVSLHEFGLNVMPILTGAGVVGVAVAFGAQALVRDVISGFFLMVEDQARVGDYITVGSTSGVVEAITLRTIVLRDVAGIVHVIPNGSVDRIANHTKEYSYFLLDLGVAYREDTDEVAQVARSVADELRGDGVLGPGILEPLEVLGVDDFGESQVTIRMRIKTLPSKQWKIGREFRRRLKKAFDARGIEIPFPQRVVHVRAATGLAPGGGPPPPARPSRAP